MNTFEIHECPNPSEPLGLGLGEGLGLLYAERDHVAQGEHYTRHVSAMTGEGLHAKSAIAAELAHRDMEIERLLSLLQRCAQALEWYADYLNEAPIWHCTGHEANTVNPLLSELRYVLLPGKVWPK